jgi:hypothetical protein
VKDRAPLHPTAAGQLAIALADEQALQQAETTPGGSPGPLAPTPPTSPTMGTSATPTPAPTTAAPRAPGR